jgi:hypothetical protein
MPANRVNQTMYLGVSAGSNIEDMNESSLYAAGELGGFIQTVSDKAYQLVKLDSGATSATGAGAVVAGDLAFWKDRSAFLVTNDKVQAVGGPSPSTAARNSVCGVFTVAATAGNFTVIQQRGRRSVVTDGGGDFVVGDFIIPSSNAAPDGDRMAAGTAPTYRTVGAVAAVESGGFTACDLNLPVDNT